MAHPQQPLMSPTNSSTSVADGNHGPYDTQSHTIPVMNTGKALTYQLPSEILSQIFQYSCPPLDFSLRYGIFHFRMTMTSHLPQRRFQFTLCAVSVHWREVAFSTPQLWTSADIKIGSATVVPRACNILQLFFAHSSVLPVDVGIQFRCGQGQGESIWSLVFENRRRIQRLYLVYPPKAWLDSLPSFDSLAHLSIEVPHGYRAGPAFIDVLCSYLALRYCPSEISLRWENVTVLRLSELRIDVCLELLTKCSHLVDFRNIMPLAREDTLNTFSLRPLPTRPFTLPYLKIFGWSYDYSCFVDQAMLENIRMPALKTLYWYEGINADCTINDPTDHTLSFFARLPSTLSTLCLNGINPPFDAFSRVIDMVEQRVEHLELENSPAEFHNYMLQTFRIRQGHGKPLFSKLKYFVIQFRAPTKPLFEQFDFDALLQMLETRLECQVQVQPQQPLYFKFHAILGDRSWLSDSREGMKELRRRGLRLEIVEDLAPYQC